MKEFRHLLPLITVVGLILIAGLIVQDRHLQTFDKARNLPAGVPSWPSQSVAQQNLKEVLQDIGASDASVDVAGSKALITLTDATVATPAALSYLNAQTPWAVWSTGRTAETITVTISKRWFLLGTDALGRDKLLQLVKATQTTVLFAALASGLALMLGWAYGGMAGYWGGTIDVLMMRTVEVFFAVPAFFWATIAILYFGNGFFVLALIVALVEWPDIARFARARSLVIRELEYVRAAQALGASDFGVFWRHIGPGVRNSMRPLAPISLTRVVALESTISFLGLGFQPPEYSLGGLIAEAVLSMQSRPEFLVACVGVFTCFIWLALATRPFTVTTVS